VITITDAAVARLHEMTEQGPEGKTLRLQKGGAGFGFIWDEEKPGDQAVCHDDTTVLVYDEHIGGLLSGRTLDMEQTEQGPALMLT
jgi:Fe-S cluster assembly iron-binding protein IscA